MRNRVLPHLEVDILETHNLLDVLESIGDMRTMYTEYLNESGHWSEKQKRAYHILSLMNEHFMEILIAHPSINHDDFYCTFPTNNPLEVAKFRKPDEHNT